ncbi:FAD-dependent oxidoreductase [Alteromonas gracilis]
MSAGERWDLAVIGGGTAGIVAAKTAARLGARTLLVERERTGGDCLWTGCVPSKTLIASAARAASARTAGEYAVRVSGVAADWSAVMRRVRSAIETIAPVDSIEELEATGVTVITGEARLTGADTLEVDGRRHRFAQAILATGAAPTVPDVPGLAEVEPLTSETLWDLAVLPERLLVLGGGSIGCELGQALARLGSRVTLVEAEDRLLGREDPDAGIRVRAALESDGVVVHTGAALAEVCPGVASLSDGREILFDRVLVAVGRTPRTGGLGLRAAGVETDERGFVVVDGHLRTTEPRIWAAGDLTGHPQLTHVAGVHGSLAASNAVLGVRRSVDAAIVPRVTYTDPEVAAVGVGTTAAAGVRLLTQSHAHVDRAVAESRTEGFTRLAVDRRGRIVGATVVGPRAGESLGELALAVRQGLRTRDLAGLTHAYPTWNDGLWNAAIGDVREQLERPATRRALGLLAGARRRLLARRED